MIKNTATAPDASGAAVRDIQEQLIDACTTSVHTLVMYAPSAVENALKIQGIPDNCKDRVATNVCAMILAESEPVTEARDALYSVAAATADRFGFPRECMENLYDLILSSVVTRESFAPIPPDGPAAEDVSTGTGSFFDADSTAANDTPAAGAGAVVQDAVSARKDTMNGRI